ncbi:PREDICTED: cation/H(+) antiporter 15-like [Nelumbo nucifera]|nr:PREDICTED: cation/H(+) antiporter 15-like [Nelumbo nucifera]
MAIVTLSTVFITAIAAPLSTIFCKQSSNYFAAAKTRGTIQNARMDSEFRVLPCIHSDEDVHAIISLLEASHPTNDNPISAYVLHLVELVGRLVPVVHHTDIYKQASNDNHLDHVVVAFKNYSNNSNGRFFFQPCTVIAPYKSMHEDICRLALEKMVALIIIPFQKKHSLTNRWVFKSSLSKLNRNVLTNAPCSVGILVHRGNHGFTMCDFFSYSILLIFLGGADDREALAYCTRMSTHPGVSVTLVRFLLWEKNRDKNNETERRMDDLVVNEFKLNNIRNGHVMYNEKVVEEMEQVFCGIRSLQYNNHNLVMVGRRHSTNLMNDITMEDWFENPELGVIGHMLESSDYAATVPSILVVQRCMLR